MYLRLHLDAKYHDVLMILFDTNVKCSAVLVKPVHSNENRWCSFVLIVSRTKVVQKHCSLVSVFASVFITEFYIWKCYTWVLCRLNNDSHNKYVN